MELEGRKVLVVGLGASGMQAAEVAARRGASVVVVDNSTEPLRADAVEDLRGAGIEVRMGVAVPDDLAGFDLVVASPGVPDRATVLEEARGLGIDLISELELGYRLLPNRFIAVTGTNGKTTTTGMIGAILEEAGLHAVTCGNIGNPVVGLVGSVGPDAVLVAEVSSFQLKNIEDFRAVVAVLLNIAPDHFDWHRDFEEYVAAKARVVENQVEGDNFVFNDEDRLCREIAGRTAATGIGFGAVPAPGRAVWIEDGWIMSGPPLEAGRVLQVSEVMLEGAHNLENVMAAAGACLSVDADREAIRRAVSAFEVIEHRMEYCGSVEGVDFCNDSKATNPHAAISALRSLTDRAVLIMGGRNKGIDLTEVVDEVCSGLADGRLKGVVLLGECAVEMEEMLRRSCPASEGLVMITATMEGSVKAALEMSEGSGTVLFSPACASFDMYDDYKHRGRAFKEQVALLVGE